MEFELSKGNANMDAVFQKAVQESTEGQIVNEERNRIDFKKIKHSKMERNLFNLE